MRVEVSPTKGLGVLHLFLVRQPGFDRSAALEAIERAKKEDTQVLTACLLGHKADVAVMALAKDLWMLRDLQVELLRSGLTAASSYVSLTEVSEYAAGMPEDRLQDRLYPKLPPEGMPAFCFYPMSKRRSEGANWYELPYEVRKAYMYGHGSVGRQYAGRVLQLITGSAGLDDWEWGVTLFAQRPDDLKEVVYTMRFDPASARFAEFGPFYTGMLADPSEALT
jgi:peroxiredoxin